MHLYATSTLRPIPSQHFGDLCFLFCGAPFLLLKPRQPAIFDMRASGEQRVEDRNIVVSSPGESHPEALAELYVSLSTHTAPIKEPCRVLPSANGQRALAHAVRGA